MHASSPSLDAVQFLCGSTPEAQFLVEGALRFDPVLMKIDQYLSSYMPVRRINHVQGNAPCLWSLDWHGQRSMLPESLLLPTFQHYAARGTRFELCFDNPYLSDEELEDEYGWGLTAVLRDSFATGLTGLSIAHEGLRQRMRAEHPALRLTAHPHLHETARQRRDARYYRQLLERYDCVTLHPADGHKTALCQQLADEASRLIIVLNDPLMRSCPARAEILRALSERRRYPYRAQARLELKLARQKAGERDLSAILQQQSNHISHAGWERLYQMGYRQYALQSQQSRSPITLMSDILHYYFHCASEMQNRADTLIANLFSLLREETIGSPSGLGAARPVPDPHYTAV